MKISHIETAVQALSVAINKETLVYDLLAAYGIPKATLSRLQKGGLNLSRIPGEILWKKKLFFKIVTATEIDSVFANVKATAKTLKHEPRFVIVTDHQTLYALDTKTGDAKQFALADLGKHYDFFLPLAGMEKFIAPTENVADVKAAERMAKLYDEIKKDNATKTAEEVHGLNVFLSRLLFCFFAEDTDIFPKDLFTSSIASHTQPDGSDLADYLARLFRILNTEQRPKNTPQYLLQFPYVNGGLFKDEHPVPTFSRRSRQALIDAGSNGWKDINPDIFGSMIQAVITPEHRGGLGMHYTSVPNIMKVIEPLFLNELNEEFEGAKHQPLRLNKLLERLGRIRIFDPACGSGNFLIISYKELRLLEMKVLARFQELQKEAVSGFEEKQLSLIPKAQLSLAAAYKPTLFSRIELHHFYGIELDDFAHEIAILSLWLAEHQMNLRFKDLMGDALPSLPLKAGGNIVHGNATRLDWEKVCPKGEGLEIYILGNPPYLGGKLQSDEQKEDTKLVFHGFNKYNNLDYIACWFYKAALYLERNAKAAFVTTNSISQGTQVFDLWPHIFGRSVEIGFAYKDFPWSNNAKNKAGVYCSIIGIRKIEAAPKYIFEGKIRRTVTNINGYLIDAPNIFIEKRTTPLSRLPEMNQGNIPLESGYLRFAEDEKNEIVSKFPNSSKLFRKVSGSDELINDITNWCVWITDNDKNLAISIPPIEQRIKKVIEFRKNGAENAKACLDRPHQFCMLNEATNSQIVIPIVSSERREYIPVSYVSSDYIILNSALVIYDPEDYIFGLINSRIHLLWVKAFAGKLETRLRYSVGLCWYSFPFPKISVEQKKSIVNGAYHILAEREQHSEKTLADLYDPGKMPHGLRIAHQQLDLAVERCYRTKPFESDEERLEYLFKLYEKMIAEEKATEMNFSKPKQKKIKTA